jgi:hypothetical protein
MRHVVSLLYAAVVSTSSTSSKDADAVVFPLQCCPYILRETFTVSPTERVSVRYIHTSAYIQWIRIKGKVIPLQA